MTTPQNRQLGDDELDLLSAYMDNQLAAAERGALEQRLGREPALRAALDELRATVALLHELTPLPPPRSFALDPAAFAPRRAPLFGWLRLGATLASVLLAITFAVEFVGNAGTPTSAPIAGAPAAAAPTAAMAESQRSALSATAAPAAIEPAPAATAAPAPMVAPAEPTAAPAAAEALEPAASKAAEPTAAPAAPEAPAAAPAPPTPSIEATVQTLESADMSATAAPAAQPTPALSQGSGYSAPPAEAPAVGNLAQPTSPPVATSGSSSPDTAQLDQSAPPQPRQAAPGAAIRPIRLAQIGLAGLALLLGLGALWVRRRGR
jgi:hypothetical protein